MAWGIRVWPALLLLLCWSACLPPPVLSSSAAPDDGPDRHHHINRDKRFSTTFGKPPTVPTPPPLIGKGRECKGDEDCEAIQYTRCSVDPRDQRRRCICRDNTPPVNGQCLNKPRGLRELCNTDAECLEGAECKINPNITHSNSRFKYCLCRAGHVELDNACNGSDRQQSSLTSLFVIALLLAACTFTID